MDDHNINIIIFAESIRKQMLAHLPPLVKHRRKLLRNHPDVFVGAEAVSWATKSLTISPDGIKFDESDNSHKPLNEEQACDLFQRLMDAGMLQNVTSQELFKNDKSFFRFSADDANAEKLIRSVAIGCRIFDSAISSDNKLFETVCAFGKLVSTECLKASQLVSFLVSSGLSNSTEASVDLCRNMVECNVLKPVDPEVQEFEDSKNFYLFEIDFRKPVLSLQQFLSSYVSSTISEPQLPDQAERSSNNHRNKLIHLRQTSDQLVDFSHLSLKGSTISAAKQNDCRVVSDCNGNTAGSASSYKAFLNTDGSLSKAALFHSTSPFVRKVLWVYPDAVGYGFVIRGSGPCYVKIVDPDSPAGKAGLKAYQYITTVNGIDVTEMPHTSIANLILSGPKVLKITVMQDKTLKASAKSTANQSSTLADSSSSSKKQSSPLPSAQPWIKNKTSSHNTGHQLISR